MEREDYCGQNLKSVIRRYFDNSIQNVVNFLIKSEEYSDEEAKEIILQISNRGKE
ncbi:BlaI/MecI/CopY family transcriptional regulator [Bacteroides acidifaciens]|uniref:BlaI/MecI/CopY family transcriptional regulator n=1 Tax=Bacteroides acidifaciens TaxID=85831 RepID=UPI002623C9D3|nr:BlaI/MecI/CopY family transcriptional regulator [Bacteroides acidifaciens]